MTFEIMSRGPHDGCRKANARLREFNKPTIFIIIGGVYGDNYRATTEISPDEWRQWKCGDIVIIKVDANVVAYKLDAYKPIGIGEFKPI